MYQSLKKNERYLGASQRESLYDLAIPLNWNKKLIIFSHGYMGFKDWGAWNLLQDACVQQGFGFIKYNVSHNGGTPDQPIDFSDLDAFAHNTYTKELADLDAILALTAGIENLQEIYLLGHSRGGGIVLLQSNHPKVSKIAVLAPISSIEKRFPSGEALNQWRKEGTRFITNGRTHQEMPHHFVQYEDYLANAERLDIKRYVRNSRVPICVIHGDADASVHISEGEEIAAWAGVELIRIEGEQHTFGAQQPWNEKRLPLGLEKVVQYLIVFFNSN
jgi:uncharacterized protein